MTSENRNNNLPAVNSSALGPVNDSSDLSELSYIQLALVVSSLTIGSYCGFEYFRQSLAEYLIVSLISIPVFITSLFYYGKGRLTAIDEGREKDTTKLLPSSLTSHPLYSKYVAVVREIAELHEGKQALFGSSILEQLKELMEVQFPQMLARQDGYKAYFGKCDLTALNHNIGKLEKSLESENDDDIRKVIERNLSIARSTQDNYQKLEKAIRLYALQISTIGQHLQNLESKIHILDLEAEKIDIAKHIEGMTSDINDIEQALAQIELPDCNNAGTCNNATHNKSDHTGNIAD